MYVNFQRSVKVKLSSQLVDVLWIPRERTNRKEVARMQIISIKIRLDLIQLISQSVASMIAL